MGDISRNFSRSEFACQCACGFATADIKLVHLLENIRGHFKTPITITSAARCSDHNKAVGGIACDIQVKNVKPYDVYCFVDGFAPNSYGVGFYESFTHIDVRKTKARWRG